MLLYLVAFLEGFSTLAVEILAIRIALPIVGSDILFTSVVLGIIMLALSFGYYSGGLLAEKLKKSDLLRLLIIYFVFSATFYYIVSFRFENLLISMLMNLGYLRLFVYFTISIVLFFPPIFLLAHSIPMLMKIKSDNVYISAGKFLLYSTLGSFLGSIAPALFLLPYLGVKVSVGIISGVLILGALLLILYNKTQINKSNISIILIFIILAIMFDGFDYFVIKNDPSIIYNHETKYQNVQIKQINYNNDQGLLMSLDGSSSSSINLARDNSLFNYIKESVKQSQFMKPTNILVIGAAGFTYPYLLSSNNYIQSIDVIDIDDQLKDISEKYFLKTKLSDKVNFINQPARYAINNLIVNKKQYDLIFIDVFIYMTIPSHLLTIEYFNDLKLLSDNIMINFIADHDLKSNYARNSLKTINQVYPDLYYNVLSKTNIGHSNIILTSFALEGYDKMISDNYTNASIYTDDKNPSDLDAYKMFYLN